MTLSTVRTSVGLLAAVAAITGATLSVDTNRSTVVDAISSTTWVSSAGAEAASRIGPGGAEVTIGLGEVAGHLQVVDLDGVAYAVDGAGTFSRIDPATFEVTVGVDLPGAELVAGSGHLYALDRNEATATELDPTSLKVLSPPVDVGDEPGSAVVDDRGVLWVFDEATGEVVRVSGDDRSAVAATTAGTIGALSVVDGDVVLVDPDESTVAVLGDDGGTERRFELEPLDRDRVLVPAHVASATVLPILDADRLVLVDVETGATLAVDLERAPNRLGAPAVAAGLAHVPDLTAGVLVSVSLETADVTAIHELDDIGNEFDLVTKGDFVYVNDATNELAWVIGPDGELTPIQKYDPDRPGSGDLTPQVPPGQAPDTSVEEFPDTPEITQPEIPQPEVPTPDVPQSDILMPGPPDAPGPPTVPPVGDPDDGGDGDNTDSGDNGDGDGDGDGDSDNGDGDGDGDGECPAGGMGPGCATTSEPCADGYSDLCPAPGDGAVGTVSAVAGDASVTARWTAPVDWYEVIGYSVTVVPYGDTANAIGPVQLGTVTEHVQTSLRNGRRYYVVVEAIGDGNRRGAPVASPLAMPISSDPGRPRSVEATVTGCAGIAVGWAAPDDGFVVAGYLVEATAVGAGSWSTEVGAATTGVTVPAAEVTFGLAHAVTVTSFDANGATSPTADGGTVVPHCVPGAPGAVTAQASGDGELLATWAPAEANGAAVDRYEIDYGSGGQPGGQHAVAGDATSATVGGLTNGSTYDIRVRAGNADGWGTWSPPASVLIQSHTPDMPGSFGAVPQDGRIDLTWAASNGNGTMVTGYTVENVTTGASAVVGATAHSFTGLANGTGYTFRVRANGANGNLSGWATAGPVTPAGAPGAPTGLTATGHDAAVALTWSPSPGNGTTVDRYEIRASGVATQATSSPHTVGGLSNGMTYTFEIRAIGANGAAGAWASAPPATPSGAPASPTGVSGTATSPHTASVTWAQASPSNGTTVDGWRVSTMPATTTQTVYSPAATLSGLDALTNYTVTVVAIGANGFESGAGTGAFGTPNGALPGALTGLSAMGGAWYAGNSCPNPATASWDPTPGADGYTVSVTGSGTFNTSSTSWADAPPVGTHQITVTPFNLYGSGAPMTQSFTMQDRNEYLCP